MSGEGAMAAVGTVEEPEAAPETAEAEEVSVVAAAEAEVPTMVAVEATTQPLIPGTQPLVTVTYLHFQVARSTGILEKLRDGVWSH